MATIVGRACFLLSFRGPVAPGKEQVRMEHLVKGRLGRLGRHMVSRQARAFAKKWERGDHRVGGVEVGIGGRRGGYWRVLAQMCALS